MSTPAWVAYHGTDVSTLYRGATTMTPTPSRLPLVVSIPQGAPTGVVWNGGTGFTVHSGMASGPALFLFSSELLITREYRPGRRGQLARTNAAKTAQAQYTLESTNGTCLVIRTC